MAKLTFKKAKDAIGVGTFVEKTIKFRDASGEEFEGEILIKVISHEEKAKALEVWGLKKAADATFDQVTQAIIFKTIYESKDKQFFPSIDDVGQVSTEILDAMYKAADEVLDFSGKNWISKKKMNSSVNSSSTELAEEQLLEQNKT